MGSDGVTVNGFVEPGFGPVADTFADGFAHGGDVGAAVTVHVGGHPVVDLWAGVADPDTGRAWDDSTVVTVFSCSKGVMATLVNLLIQDGRIDPDEPVATYWPEFAANGKDHITVRTLLSHQAGLARIDVDVTLEEALEGSRVVDALAAQAPHWEPGTRHGYHMRSFGWLTGELVRRVTGVGPAALLRSRLVEPLGLSMWLGMPVDQQARCATVVPPDPATTLDIAAIFGADSLTAAVFTGPSDRFHYDTMWNTPGVRAATIPSSGGISDARSLSRLYAACVGEVGGVRLFDRDTAASAAEPQAVGPDAILGVDTGYGLGYGVGPSLPPACPPGSFGHGGAGGSMAFADPSAGVGFGYVLNRMRLDLDDRRAANLAGAVYRCVG